MGYAARNNPRSLDGGKSVASVQRARLERMVGQLRTQDQLDIFLHAFPEHQRAQVHRVIEPMLPALVPAVAMTEVYPVDPSAEASWVTLKACSHRVLRQLACGCWAAGYGYSIAHATERVNQIAHIHEEAPV